MMQIRKVRHIRVLLAMHNNNGVDVTVVVVSSGGKGLMIRKIELTPVLQKVISHENLLSIGTTFLRKI